MFEFEFMRLAFMAGAVVGILAPAVGFFLVQRQMSLVGDGIGHVAFAGVALGILIDVSPILTALVVAVLGGIAIEWLRARRVTAGDQALALVFYTGIAAGVVLGTRAEETLELDRGAQRIAGGGKHAERLVSAELDELAAVSGDPASGELGEATREPGRLLIAVLVRVARVAADVGDQERTQRRARRALLIVCIRCLSGSVPSGYAEDRRSVDHMPARAATTNARSAFFQRHACRRSRTGSDRRAVRRCAVGTRSMEHDVVLRELVAARARDLLQGALERRVVEHLDAPALITDEVVMVFPAREGWFEARDTAAENDAMDESEIRELLEYAVDARDADALAVVAEAVE